MSREVRGGLNSIVSLRFRSSSLEGAIDVQVPCMLYVLFYS